MKQELCYSENLQTTFCFSIDSQTFLINVNSVLCMQNKAAMMREQGKS